MTIAATMMVATRESALHQSMTITTITIGGTPRERAGHETRQ